MLIADNLKQVILNEMQAQGFPLQTEVQGEIQNTGLDKLATALAIAIIDYLKQNAEVVVQPGTFLISAQAGVPNPSPVILTLR